MILQRWEFRHAHGMPRGYRGGGDSSSESSTTQQTTNQDNRVAIQGGAQIGGFGTSVNGLTINDSAAQIVAMNLVGSSTSAALSTVANTGDNMIRFADLMTAASNAREKAAYDAAGGAVGQALRTVENATSSAIGASTRAVDTVKVVAQDAMAGTWGAADDLSGRLIAGMNQVLSSSRDLLSAQSQAAAGMAGDIKGAFATASDVSTGNRQLVTAALAVVGSVAAVMFWRGRA